MVKIIGLAGWSGAGKTTLLVKVIPVLVRRGLRVSTVKHAHHAFEVDKPGKDTFRHREAGATEVLISSSRKWALIHELRDDDEATLFELLPKLSQVDLVIVEGFKREAIRKVEVHRRDNTMPFLFPEDPNIIGVVSDVTPDEFRGPTVHLDSVDEIADLLIQNAGSFPS